MQREDARDAEQGDGDDGAGRGDADAGRHRELRLQIRLELGPGELDLFFDERGAFLGDLPDELAALETGQVVGFDNWCDGARPCHGDHLERAILEMRDGFGIDRTGDAVLWSRPADAEGVDLDAKVPKHPELMLAEASHQ